MATFWALLWGVPLLLLVLAVAVAFATPWIAREGGLDTPLVEMASGDATSDATPEDAAPPRGGTPPEDAAPPLGDATPSGSDAPSANAATEPSSEA